MASNILNTTMTLAFGVCVCVCERCWSYLGRQGGRQSISLMKNGCLYQSTVQHEVLHALGFHHEQVRSDRDRYVQILTQNIQPGQLTHRNFSSSRPVSRSIQ